MKDGSIANAVAPGWTPDHAPARKRGILARPAVAVLSSYPPRECGIATFARDLIGAIESTSHLRHLTRLPTSHPWVIAINEAGQSYDYESRVRWTIDRDDRASYRRVADEINRSHVRVVSIQHEYGLYGGEDGEYLLDFMEQVRRPIVLTMHTVLEHPTPSLRLTTEHLINQSDAVVVLAESAREILATSYRRARLDKLQLIHHGTPTVRFEATKRHQRRMGLDGHTVLSTFGLLGPDKGIEYAIRALPEIVAQHPEVVYLILGQTHPGQRRFAGESYREMLKSLVDELDLRDHVRFYNHYLSTEELIRFLRATDVYVMPYLNPEQIVSGTLAYAVACGKAIVATPFTYAREMLGEERGMLARFRDPQSISTAVNTLLDDPTGMADMQLRAFNHGRRMHWPAVGTSYCRLYQRVIDDYHTRLRESAHAARRRAVVGRRLSPSRPAVAAATALGLAPGHGAPPRAATAALGTGLRSRLDMGLSALSGSGLRGGGLASVGGLPGEPPLPPPLV